jgi:hypothetical protein
MSAETAAKTSSLNHLERLSTLTSSLQLWHLLADPALKQLRQVGSP